MTGPERDSELGHRSQPPERGASETAGTHAKVRYGSPES
jgi:hypothetical protein